VVQAKTDDDGNVVEIDTVAHIQIGSKLFESPVKLFASDLLGVHQQTPMWIVGRLRLLDTLTVSYVGANAQPFNGIPPSTIVWHNLHPAQETADEMWNRFASEQGIRLR